jgi:glycosyltransferase involved in cell wall biosynthesis
MSFKPNMVISEDISNLPNGLLCAFYSRLKTQKYGIIGLGKILNKKESKLKSILKIPINYFRNNASFFIAYSTAGKKYYADEYHKNVISWNNSIMEKKDVDLKPIKEKYELNQYNLIYIGRIESFKKLDMLLQVVEDLSKTCNLTVHIIGDGSGFESLKQKFNSNIYSWYGKITDATQKKDIFSKMHLGVMPGSGGLAIQELQSHAIPVLTSYSDGTEIDLVKKINPSLFMEESNLDSLKETLLHFCKSSNEEQYNMAKNAYTITQEDYNIDQMTKLTKNFIQKELTI